MRNIVCCWDLKEPFVEICIFDCSQLFNKSFVEKPCGWFNTRKKELLSVLMNHNILNATSAVYRLFVRFILCNSKTLLIIFWIFTGHLWRKWQKTTRNIQTIAEMILSTFHQFSKHFKIFQTDRTKTKDNFYTYVLFRTTELVDNIQHMIFEQLQWCHDCIVD